MRPTTQAPHCDECAPMNGADAAPIEASPVLRCHRYTVPELIRLHAIKTAADVIRVLDAQTTAQGRGRNLSSVPGFEGADFLGFLEGLTHQVDLAAPFYVVDGNGYAADVYHNGTDKGRPVGETLTEAARECSRRNIRDGYADTSRDAYTVTQAVPPVSPFEVD